MRHLLLAGLVASPLALAEPATLLRDTELRASPLADATVVAPLQAQSTVDITNRQGAWAQVKTPAGQSGWVRVLNLRTGSGQRGDVGIGAMASVFRTGSSGNTVSTGVKGLSAEQISQATPNDAEVARLGTLAVKEADARQFASQGKLASQSVDYLPDAEPEPAKKRRK
ncbi:MAG: SH3 domain-containing protein [Moraxellaceae bacterium]